ncbi:hypothetical protein EDF56_1223 [Novosphingobium sp. PhB165]|nr:hypothetical protein EDF56_1223 [Novosphingobium sp. PhB165]
MLTADRPHVPAAIRFDLGAIFVSMELSKSTWLITSLSPGAGERMSKHVLRAGDISGLVERFTQLQARAQRRTGQEFGFIVASEWWRKRHRPRLTAQVGSPSGDLIAPISGDFAPDDVSTAFATDHCILKRGTAGQRSPAADRQDNRCHRRYASEPLQMAPHPGRSCLALTHFSDESDYIQVPNSPISGMPYRRDSIIGRDQAQSITAPFCGPG